MRGLAAAKTSPAPIKTVPSAAFPQQGMTRTMVDQKQIQTNVTPASQVAHESRLAIGQLSASSWLAQSRASETIAMPQTACQPKNVPIIPSS